MEKSAKILMPKCRTLQWPLSRRFPLGIRAASDDSAEQPAESDTFLDESDCLKTFSETPTELPLQ